METIEAPTSDAPDTSAVAETSPSPAETAPDAVANSAPTQYGQPAANDVKGQAAAALLRGDKGAAEKLYGSRAPKPAGVPDAGGQQNPDEANGEMVGALSDDEIHLLNRFHIKDDALVAVESLPAEMRQPLLNQLQNTIKFTGSVLQERDQLKQQLAQLQAAQSAAPQRKETEFDPDDLKMLAAQFGEDGAKAILQMNNRNRASFTPPAAAPTGPDPVASATLGFLQSEHLSRGWDTVTKQSNLKLTDDQRQAVKEKAFQLLRASVDQNGKGSLNSYNYTHAIPEAFGLLFKTDLEKQAALKLAQQGQRALRGSPDSANRPGTTGAQRTESDRKSEAVRRLLNGDDPELVRKDLQFA